MLDQGLSVHTASAGDNAPRRGSSDAGRRVVRSCSVCAGVIDGPHLTDAASGATAHPACVAAHAGRHALVALAEMVACVLVPPLVVWAG